MLCCLADFTIKSQTTAVNCSSWFSIFCHRTAPAWCNVANILPIHVKTLPSLSTLPWLVVITCPHFLVLQQRRRAWRALFYRLWSSRESIFVSRKLSKKHVYLNCISSYSSSSIGRRTRCVNTLKVPYRKMHYGNFDFHFNSVSIYVSSVHIRRCLMTLNI